MAPRNAPYDHWQGGRHVESERFLIDASTFPDASADASGQSLAHAHISFPVDLGSTLPFNANDQLFQPHHLVPLTDSGFPQSEAVFPTDIYQGSSHSAFLGHDPVVHEGFVPAPGHDDINEVYATNSEEDEIRDDSNTSSEEEDMVQERILHEVEAKNDAAADEDYTTSGEEIEYDPDEMLDEENDSEAEPGPARKRKYRTGGVRGGRRGRPSKRGQGGFRGGGLSRAQKSSGRGKRKRGRRPTVDPGPRFKALVRQANDAFAGNDYAKAMDFAQQAIQLNPEIFSAHNLLSEIYAAMGHETMAIQSLMVGAPTLRDVSLWWDIVGRIDQVDPKKYPFFTDELKVAMQLSCLRSIITLDNTDFAARSRKLEIEAKLGNVGRCVTMCRTMLAIKPHDYDTLKSMAVFGTSSPRETETYLDRIIESFELSIDHFTANEDPDQSALDWSLLNIYLDLLDRAGDYDRALFRLKLLCRWKQKRRNETYWDDQRDDREFDLDDAPRRIAVSDFSRRFPAAKYGKTLPLELRIKMGLFRLKQTPCNFSEAMHHLEFLEPDDQEEGAFLHDYPDIFRVVADTLHATGHDREAIRFYEPIFDHAQDELNLKSFLGLYTCYKTTRQEDKASKIISMLVEWDMGDLDDLTVLAKFFEDIGMQDEAMERAEKIFRGRAAWRLRKIGFQGYNNVREHFSVLRRADWGKQRTKKMRASTYSKKARVAAGRTLGPDVEKHLESGSGILPGRPIAGPSRERPKEGLFRVKTKELTSRPPNFLEIGCSTLEGTDVSTNAIDQKIFRRKLERLALDHADELQASRTQHRDIVASFERLDILSGPADDKDEAASSEYLTVARELVEEFTTFELFYFDRREDFVGYYRRIKSGDVWKDSAVMALAVEANRIEDGGEGRELKEKTEEVPEDFYGIHFDKWLEVCCRYALYLARAGESKRSFSTLDVCLQSNIFYRIEKYHRRLELCRLSCGICADDSYQVAIAIRYLLKAFPFGTDLFRLFGAANRLCVQLGGYSHNSVGKAFLRYIKTIDYALLKPSQRVWFNFRGDDRTEWMSNEITTTMLEKAKGHDPALFALHAHIQMCTGSHAAALNYYFRAYALAPDDPIVNLSLGVAYIQHALKRLSENRQFQIQQGLSFVYRYYDLRTKENVAIHSSEAEFNLGRVWHMLGLLTQALVSYKRCVALSERVRQEAANRCGDGERPACEDFATEAAFAMQSIYTLSGHFEGAQRVTDDLLVIE